MIDDDRNKFRHYRTLVYILAFILLFELAMLTFAIPEKSTFITVTLTSLGVLNAYLIVLCMRLIKELQENSKK